MTLVSVLTISKPNAGDAPTVIVFDAMPLLSRLIDAAFATDNSWDKAEWGTYFQKIGLTDKALARMSVLLVTARQAGEWPSIENRLEDGSLLCWQLLTLNNCKTLKQVIESNARARQAKKN